MGLKNIQQGVQQIVSAIAAVLKIEVEVADNELFRISGTGLLKRKIWTDMYNEDTVFRRCLEIGETIIVDRPGVNEICRSCSHYGNCEEKGEICSPIKMGDTVIGVIGLIALNEEQKQRLFDNKDENILFLEKMADVIATKVKEYCLFHQKLLAEQKISTLLHYMDNGVIMLNQKGQCEFISDTARQMLRLGSFEMPSDMTVQELLEQNDSSIEGGNIVYVNVGSYSRKLFATYYRIETFEQGETAVIILENPDYIKSVASHLSIKEKSVQPELIGAHPMMHKVKELLPRIADGMMSVLITGEPGTGKAFIAQYIHQFSHRAKNQFLSLNCSFYSEEKLDNELFGYEEKGKHVPGKLELADGSTLFLEEIHSLPLSLQIKLLKFIGDQLIYRQGKHYEVNVRLISSTDKQLLTLMQDGLFRQDLYYKLNMIPISIPSLHNRKQDILLLATHFLRLLNDQQQIPMKVLNDHVKDIFLAYNWPGNIQELVNVMEYVHTFEVSAVITEASLPEYLLLETSDKVRMNHQQFNLRQIEQETILRALMEIEKKGGRKEDAATLLGIGRATLFRKINEFQLGENR